MIFRKLYIKWQVLLGKAIDIWSKSPYPANVLSNLYANEFYYDGVRCGSMEGFLQSLKYLDKNRQQDICAMSGKEAKSMTNRDWQSKQIVWWRGVAIDRHSDEFQKLIHGAYRAMFNQNEQFRIALISTLGKRLYHSQGEQSPYKTILTESEFCSVLTDIRDSVASDYR